MMLLKIKIKNLELQLKVILLEKPQEGIQSDILPRKYFYG